MRRLLQLVIPGVLLSGCFGPGEGVEVPQDQIYFPVGLAMSQDSQHLFVVSSDFDLQYNGGAVQSFDLDGLSKLLPRNCATNDDCAKNKGEDPQQRALTKCDTAAGLCIGTDAKDPTETPCQQGDRPGSDRLLFPGRCNPIDTAANASTANPAAKLIATSTVKIGAFATDEIIRENSSDTESAPERLFVPVRGDSTLHWLDVNSDGTLDCGQVHNKGACDDAHRAGNNPTENLRDIQLNAEPFAIDADASGNKIVVTNQTTGTASLFTTDPQNWRRGPQLAFALASNNIPSSPVGIAAIPQPSGSDPRTANDTFMMTFRNSAQVRLVTFAPDLVPESPSMTRPYLVDDGGVPIDANSVGSDSRGIAIDSTARQDALARCAGDGACVDSANLVPLDVYVANRAPSTLLIGRTRPPQDYPYFFQTFALTTGPSRIVIGHVTPPGGERESRVFVVCFDSRRIFVYDPKRSRIESEILTGRGPFAVAVDEKRKLLYVGHFTDSYIGVYSLDLAFPATYGTMLGSLGTPKSPRASK